MKLNDNKMGMLAGIGFITAMILALIVGMVFVAPFFSITAPTPSGNGNKEIDSNEEISTGVRIAQYMEALEEQIVFVWSCNNTWVNQNLTTIYSTYIDGLLAGINKTTNESVIALVHEPQVDSAVIDLNKVTVLFEDFRNLIEELSNTTEIDFQAVFPPTFVIDSAYSDDSSIFHFSGIFIRIQGLGSY